ncbi:molybdate transport system ATP-binding protein [Rhodococcus sp. 27YEA15]
MSSLHVDIDVPERDVTARFDVAAGEVTAILGPNGAGKSTVLAAIAGLQHPQTGRIELGGRMLTDTDAGIALPPHRRGTVLLAQSAMLFPHLTALDNVAFAPRSAGRSRRDSAAAAQRWLESVDAGEFAKRKPSQLSGGQAQRVAVARALAAEPELLLLDEPMSALDVASAPALRSLLRRVLRTGDRTAILVTHDALDALALADTVVVLDGGRVVERGDVRTVLSRPRSAFAARIAGINLRIGTVSGDGVLRTPEGGGHSRSDGGRTRDGKLGSGRVRTTIGGCLLTGTARKSAQHLRGHRCGNREPWRRGAGARRGRRQSAGPDRRHHCRRGRRTRPRTGNDGGLRRESHRDAALSAMMRGAR